MVETKVDSILRRLDAHDAATADLSNATANLSKKLDQVLRNQADGSADRAAIKAEIAAMKPDVQTITDAKRVWRYGRWIVGTVAAGITALAAAKGWIILNLNYLMGIPPR